MNWSDSALEVLDNGEQLCDQSRAVTLYSVTLIEASNLRINASPESLARSENDIGCRLIANE